MKNPRNAGRKKQISEETIQSIWERYRAGEKISKLAEEFGVTRQALYKRMQEKNTQPIVLEYFVEGRCATRIEVDVSKESIHIVNYAKELSKKAFGLQDNPSWKDFAEFLEEQYRKIMTKREYDTNIYLCQETNKTDFSVVEILQKQTNQKEFLQIPEQEKIDHFPAFHFTKKDILYTRTDTDGYQLKALSKDRRFFVKSQAAMGTELMDDWAVELIADDLCEQLQIPHVHQEECRFIYAEREWKAVFSKNFELDGYTFISFERLLERMGLSSKDSEFVHLNAIEKLKWCAHRLSQAGNLSYDECQKYMLDMAVLDCILGNVDRHTRNFGLFYNTIEGCYEIPLVFDNGMGLFEHDSYRKQYKSFEEAMRTVYVSPYGEDPFDLLDILEREFSITQVYPALKTLSYKNYPLTSFATEYMERMVSLWQK